MNKNEIAALHKKHQAQLKEFGRINLNDACTVDALVNNSNDRSFVKGVSFSGYQLFKALRVREICLSMIVANYANGKLYFDVFVSDDKNRMMRKSFRVKDTVSVRTFVSQFAKHYFDLFIHLTRDIILNPFSIYRGDEMSNMNAKLLSGWQEV